MTLIDFTLSNARRFYSSIGNPSDTEGLMLDIEQLTNHHDEVTGFLVVQSELASCYTHLRQCVLYSNFDHLR